MGKAFETIQHRDDHFSMHSHSRLNSVCCLSALCQFLKFTTVPHFIRSHRHKYRGPRILAELQIRHDYWQYKTFIHFFLHISVNTEHVTLCHTVLHQTHIKRVRCSSNPGKHSAALQPLQISETSLLVVLNICE